jgi:Uma2 family endonuclease
MRKKRKMLLMEQRATGHLMTEQEYLDFERSSETKHEFYAGEIFAMAGSTPDHALITMNLGSALKSALRDRDCLVYSPDLRIKNEASGLQTYADVAVLCGEANFTDDNPPALTNPTLIAEVLSESTEGYDRGKKFHHYCRIPSLTTYLLVSQNAPTIEALVRQAEFQWEHRVITGLEKLIEIPAWGIQIALREIFAGVKFPPSALRQS